MTEFSLSMRDLPDSERPRERLFSYGAAALSNAELLAIILRTGSQEENVLHLCERVLAQYQGLQGLAQATATDLEQFRGLGKAKIAQLMAVLELGKRLTAYQPGEHPIVQNAADAARLVKDMSNLPQEHVRAILLDTSNQVIAIPTIYIGTLNASVLRVSEVYREAITRNSPAMILAHNHPSGDPSPSPDDIEITRSLFAAGKLLDIALLDHLIIGRQRWVSFKEMGLVFNR
jgi:DNA repair protein RadC